MSNNFEFHMWLAHAGHDVYVTAFEGRGRHDSPPLVAIGCNDCKMNVEVWEYQEEYENV